MLSRRRFVAALAAAMAALPARAWGAPKPTATKKKVVKKPAKKPTPKRTPAPTAPTSTQAPTPTQTPVPSQTREVIIAVDELRVGTAKIVSASRQGREVTVAVSRLSSGFVVVDAVCTHAGCIVQLAADNDLLCLCHRSRFDRISGAVLDSPATRPLVRYEVEVRGEYLYFR